MIAARIVLDSVNQAGNRLTTWELTYPRFIHSEIMTHRMLSRNAASSRAIPISKMISAVVRNPAVPIYWGKNQKGMQAKQELSGARLWFVKQIWLKARYLAVVAAWLLFKLDLHKQIANRVLEPWMHMTVIVSATEMDNFFKLRAHPDAQPEFQDLAFKMKKLYDRSAPQKLQSHEWHLPFVDARDVKSVAKYIDQTSSNQRVDDCLKKISVARCARVSYTTHDKVGEIINDLKLCERLSASGHWSPFEHVAQASPTEISSNFVGWTQYRKLFSGESGKNA